jgi:hypothetical protein
MLRRITPYTREMDDLLSNRTRMTELEYYEQSQVNRAVL